MNMKEDITC